MIAAGLPATQSDRRTEALLTVSCLSASGAPVAEGRGFLLSGTNLLLADLPEKLGDVRYQVDCDLHSGPAGMKAYDHALGLALLQMPDFAPAETAFALRPQLPPHPGMRVQVFDSREGAFVERRITAMREIPWGKVCLIDPAPAPDDAGTPVLDLEGRTVGIIARVTTDGRAGAAVVSARRLDYILRRAMEGPVAPPHAGDAAARPHTTSLILSGLVAEEDGEITASLDYYRQAAAADPLCAGVHVNLGRALARAGDPEAAIRAYTRAIELNGHTAAAFHYRALAYNALGRLDEAKADWTRMIELASRARQAFYNRGLIRLKQDDLSGAEEDFSQAIALHPNYFHARIGRGKVRLRRENANGAVRDFLCAVRVDRQSPAAWALLGEAFARCNRPRAAQECFARDRALRRDTSPDASSRPGSATGSSNDPASPLLRRTPDADPAPFRRTSVKPAPAEMTERTLPTPEAPAGHEPPQRRGILRLFFTFVPLLILGVSAYGAYWLIQTRPTPPRVAQETKPALVEVLAARRTTEPLTVSAMGTVIPAQSIALSPQVSGRIIAQSSELAPGGRFRNGDVVARIDPRDYELLVEQQKAAVERARYELKMEESRQAVAQREWEQMPRADAQPDANADLALRKPQLRAAQAAVAAAESALQLAQLNLDRAVIRAPFDALIQERSVDVGQLVGPQTRIATLVGTDQFWVQVAVPVEKLEYIRIPDVNGATGSRASIVYSAGASAPIVREGAVLRLQRDLDPTGRMARVLVAVEDPLALKSAELRPLLLGAYVRVVIEARPMENVCVVPRAALREGDEVWVMDSQDQLAVRKVEIVWRREDSVLVRGGVETGDRIVTSRIPFPIPGMKLRAAESLPSGTMKSGGGA